MIGNRTARELAGSELERDAEERPLRTFWRAVAACFEYRAVGLCVGAFGERCGALAAVNAFRRCEECQAEVDDWAERAERAAGWDPSP